LSTCLSVVWLLSTPSTRSDSSLIILSLQQQQPSPPAASTSAMLLLARPDRESYVADTKTTSTQSH